MPLAKYQDMVKALAPDRADQPFSPLRSKQAGLRRTLHTKADDVNLKIPKAATADL